MAIWEETNSPPEVVSSLVRAGHSQTVVSGNMAETGWLKLRHAHLSEFMAPRFSAFGDRKALLASLQDCVFGLKGPDAPRPMPVDPFRKRRQQAA